jgi:hypothetical protein
MLEVGWDTFYRYISSDKKFREIAEKYANMSDSERKKEIKTRLNNNENPPDDNEKVLFEMDSNLWTFLSLEKDTIFKIQNWEIYRRAAEVVKEDPRLAAPKVTSSDTPSWVPKARLDEDLIKLLQEGKVRFQCHT